MERRRQTNHARELAEIEEKISKYWSAASQTQSKLTELSDLFKRRVRPSPESQDYLEACLDVILERMHECTSSQEEVLTLLQGLISESEETQSPAIKTNESILDSEKELLAYENRVNQMAARLLELGRQRKLIQAEIHQTQNAHVRQQAETSQLHQQTLQQLDQTLASIHASISSAQDPQPTQLLKRFQHLELELKQSRDCLSESRAKCSSLQVAYDKLRTEAQHQLRRKEAPTQPNVRTDSNLYYLCYVLLGRLNTAAHNDSSTFLDLVCTTDTISKLLLAQSIKMRQVVVVVVCLTILSVASASSNRIDCQNRRGVKECRSLGQDCMQTEITNDAGQKVMKITFPMKQHTLEFPCSSPFEKQPIVMTSIRQSVAGSTKLFQSSLRSVGPDSFSVNVQRVDDVDEPDMSCQDYELCYIAITM